MGGTHTDIAFPEETQNGDKSAEDPINDEAKIRARRVSLLSLVFALELCTGRLQPLHMPHTRPDHNKPLM